jgi:biotin synthase
VTAVPELDDLTDAEVLNQAREAVLERGEGLSEPQVLRVLKIGDEHLSDLLALAHEVRTRWCGPEVEVEGIVSVKTGGCPEDCHFCSQSGQFPTPVRSAWLDIPGLVEAAKQTAATGATEFCIVAAVRGPDARLMTQMREGVAAIRAAVDINVAASLGMLTKEQVDELAAMGVHRYNHNLETAQSYFPQVVTTHTWQERWDTLRMVRDAGMEVCCGGILGLGETRRDRASLLHQLAILPEHPGSIPINDLMPIPGTPIGDKALAEGGADGLEFVRAVAVARIVCPKSVVRLSAGREHMSRELQALCFVAGANSVFLGSRLLTTANPGIDTDERLFADLGLKPMGAAQAKLQAAE